MKSREQDAACGEKQPEALGRPVDLETEFDRFEMGNCGRAGGGGGGGGL